LMLTKGLRIVSTLRSRSYEYSNLAVGSELRLIVTLVGVRLRPRTTIRSIQVSVSYLPLSAVGWPTISASLLEIVLQMKLSDQNMGTFTKINTYL
uniref:Secreted protein n=1 Tax=Haemonchus placei TaxID=6290 RepID=A0A0N4VUV5_HAEPC